MMLNWILSSSVLILGIIGIRFLFQKKMKCKLQYALWLLVLIRLLVPFSIGHSSMSVSNTVSTISPIVMEQSQVTEQPWDEVPMEPPVLPVGGADRNPGMEKQPASPMVEAGSVSFREMLPKILSGIWITGSIVTGMTFLSANLTFRRRLKISRHRIPAYPCKLPVYVTNRIQSPCLFGLSHPAIYLTRQVMEDESMIRHTVAHEFTHYRHKDHMWAILRGVCLTIHWFNPLVWWAAILSQRDAELACDEDTIKVLGEGERKAYGMTLIHVSCQKNTNLLTAATTMTADKKVLKQRIQTIARKRKNVALAVIAVTFLAAAFVGCTFSGAEKAKKEVEPLPGETTIPTGEASRKPALWDEIISGTGSFYSVDFGRDMTLGDFCSTFAEGNTLKPQRYALADLDRDGTEEVILELSIGEDNPMGSLILHQSGDRYVGYSRYHRQMSNIKEDGTFHWSGGAGNNGFARVTGFGPNDIMEVNITWVDDTEGPASFYVNGEKAEESQYWAAVEEEEAKQEVKWLEYPQITDETAPQDNRGMQEEISTLLMEAEKKDRKIQEKEQTTYAQQDMNVLSMEKYENWDNCLNGIWKVLREHMPESELQELKKEQITWIQEKEAAIEKTGKEHEGGSIRPLAVNSVAANWTRERVYFLAKLAGVAQEFDGRNARTNSLTTFTLRDGTDYPVSWISGGVQQLCGDMGPYSLWQDSLMSGAQVPDSLGPVEQNGQNRGELRLYSNGSWDFFPDSVQVQSYEPGELTWDSPWYTYFYEKLGSYGSYSPIIIQKAVTFTWNGRQAELVTASNLIEVSLENTEDGGAEYFDTPGNKGPSVYTFATLFLDGRTACDLYDSCYMIPSEQSEDDSEILYEAKEGYIPYMTTWQYDMEGNVIEVPLYVNDTGLHSLLPHTSRLSSLVSDLDGDGDSEILICTEAYSSLYSNYQVYDMNNGEVSVSFSAGMN